MSATKNREEEERQRKYKETRDDLLVRQLSNSEKFDGAILTLSTAALGFSLSFLSKVVRANRVQCSALLTLSWCFFALAIISTISSFLASQLGIKRQLEYAENYYLEKRDEYLYKKNRPAEVTEWLNYASAFLFIFGILSTVVFVSYNI